LAGVQGHAVAGTDFGKVLHLDDGLHIVGRGRNRFNTVSGVSSVRF
jgi:hypothetical protein